MKKDIDSLTGLEFENLCQQLLQKMGFETEMTKASGDGGIDIIARNYMPLLKGKYIVQCKRYTGSVGEPIIRDLYGVVMSERANKGILLTTGYFTRAALSFAEDKNLELIDGTDLQKIMNEYDFDVSEKKVLTISFLKNPDFDLNKYNFYKNMISQNSCSNEMGEDFVFKFLFAYFVGEEIRVDHPYKYFSVPRYMSSKLRYTNNGVIFNEMKENSHNKIENYSIIYYGLKEEYARILKWYITKFLSKGKMALELAELYRMKYEGIMQLYRFDFFDYVKQRYSVLTSPCKFEIWYYKKSNSETLGETYILGNGSNERDVMDLAILEEIIANKDNHEIVSYNYSAEYCELMNLYSIFKFFSIKKGLDYIENKLFSNNMELKSLIEIDKLYCNAKGAVIIYPNIYARGKTNTSGKVKVEAVRLLYCNLLDMSEYYNRYMGSQEDKIRDEIQKIEYLLDSI